MAGDRAVLSPTVPVLPMTKRRGRYVLVERLAEGGMGSVWAALRDGASTLCVLKLIRADLGNNDIATQRFYREAAVGSQLIHPRIAQVLGAGNEDGVFCIAMELVPGLDLETMHRAMVSKGRLLPTALVTHVAIGVLQGLAYAHGAKDAEGTPIEVVHRDITPRNIMVGFDGESKVIDFGLVRGGGGDFRTNPGAFLGTPRFSSPEQVCGEPIDRRSDLYSLSVVLFECLTGRPLVPSGSLLATFKAICNEEPPALHHLNPAVSAELSAVILRGLVKDRNHRWQDGNAYARALAAASTTIDAAAVAGFMAEYFREEAARVRALLDLGETLVCTSGSRPAMALLDTLPEPPARSGPDERATGAAFVEFRGSTTPAPNNAQMKIPADSTRPMRIADLSPSSRRRGTSWWVVIIVGILAAAAASVTTTMMLKP